MTKQFRVEGIGEVSEVLSQLAPKHAIALLRSTVDGIAREVAKDIKAHAPVDTGKLKKSIKAKRRKQRRANVATDVVTSQWYWRFPEYVQRDGTNKAYVRPAAMRAESNIGNTFRTQFVARFRRAITRELQRRAKQ